MKTKILLFFVLIAGISNLYAQNVPSYVPTNGLIGYWPFNGNANDESGNGNNGTVTGATLTTDRNGIVNSAYSFKGSATPENSGGGVDYINVIPKNSINTLITDGLTISAWFNLNDLNSNSTIFNLSNNSTNENYGVVFDKVAKLISGNNGVFNSNPIIDIHNSQIPIINNWYHVVLSVDYLTNKTSLYVNGKLDGESSNNPIKTNFDRFKMGNWNDNGYWFANGKLDDFGIWNRALTQQEISALYTGNTISTIPSYVPTNGLVGWWPFNGNANDESGNGFHGTVNGASLSNDRNGKLNSSYSFTANPQNIVLTNLHQNNLNGYSVCGWFLKNSNSVNQEGTIISGSEGSMPAGLRLDIGSINRFQFDLEGNPGGNGLLQNKPGDNTNYCDSKWHFFAATFYSPTGKVSSSAFNVYVDGIPVQKISYHENWPTWDTIVYAPINNGNRSTIIGNCNGGAFNNTDFFNGQLDDIAIYNRALTPEEISAFYSENPASSALSSTKVYVDAPATTKQNDTLQLAISTETLNTVDNVIAYQTDFSYDTTRYTYLSNNLAGTINSVGNAIVNSSKNGKLTISYMSQTALNAAGSLLKLKFKSNNTLGQGVFGLSNFLYNTTAITNLKSDTVNTIDGVPPTANISYSVNPARKGDSLLITVNFNEKMAVSPVPQLNLSGQNTLSNSNLTKVNDTTYTFWWVVEKGNGAVNVNLATGQDLGGNAIVAIPTQNPSFTVLPTFFGDIDTNTLVQAYDAALALQYSVGLNPLPTMDPLPWSNWRLAVANVDTVGNVTANDASLILQHSAKLISTFPADAKKRGGDAPVANVTVSQEGNQLVFRATGTLYAFNVFMKDHFNALGQPEVKDKNAITAANINASTYNVGIASTTPFTENEPFLVIPVLTTETLQGSMDIVANTQEKALAYGAAASITSLNKESMVVYPNPTKDVVTINNAQGNTLRIVDVQGKEVYNALITTAKTEISLKSLGAKGMYVLHILDANNVSIQSKQIVLE